MAKHAESCEWIGLRRALREFAMATHGTTSQRHIKPLHWYIACRLCIEGGFDPDEITPRPPFRVVTSSSGKERRRTIEHVPELGGSGERTILGGLRTKQVDVVVTKPGIGPVIAVSMKGTLKAFRNLTNRLEEAGGDCTNLHITYPALVYAYWAVLRANWPGPVPPNAPTPLRSESGMIQPNDVAIREDGKPHPCIIRYHQALSGLSARSHVRNDVSRYEAVALTLVNAGENDLGTMYAKYPPEDGALRFERFLHTIYRQYDLRFVYQAPDLASQTHRNGWDETSPALQNWDIEEYQPRPPETDDQVCNTDGAPSA